MSRDEKESAICNDGSVMKAASGGGSEQFRGRIRGIGEVNSRRAGAFRDEDNGKLVIKELGIEIDRDSIGELAFDGEGIEWNREDIEAVLVQADGGEEDGAGRIIHF